MAPYRCDGSGGVVRNRRVSMPSASSHSDTFPRVETIIRRDLKFGPDITITEDMPFFGGDADIDSLDILLLLSSVEKEFALRIPSEAVGREVFATVGSLVRHIEQHRAGGGATGAGASPAPAPSIDPLSRLPHGEPFRFVTRVLAVTDGESAEGVWSLTGGEPFFAGHFPGQPLVPGVLIAEALAQVSGLAAGVRQGNGRLAQVDVRFEQPVAPPAEIRLTSRLTRTMGGLRQFDVTAFVDAAVVARGTVTLSFGG
jgi:3-hydroxyacyl-[acyl-carrier-protein] dehydratase